MLIGVLRQYLSDKYVYYGFDSTKFRNTSLSIVFGVSIQVSYKVTKKNTAAGGYPVAVFYMSDLDNTILSTICLIRASITTTKGS